MKSLLLITLICVAAAQSCTTDADCSSNECCGYTSCRSPSTNGGNPTEPLQSCISTDVAGSVTEVDSDTCS